MNSEQTLHNTLRDIYTVSRLNREVRSTLEGSFPLIWLEGEISNLARPASGHWYFTLKDEAAQVRCAMFRGRNRLINCNAENGTKIIARARVGLYEARGEFQLVIEQMEDAGDGALRRSFDELKLKLLKEGLFDEKHKQPLPAIAEQVGIITSSTGAAIHDILTTLKRRFPALPVVVYPVSVQGDLAAAQITQAIELANKRKECDVLILARGGGSLEDLSAFNDEQVARAIHHSRLPVISGIGHEVDVTIADFVADFRAATPTAAAEMVSPDQQQWLTRLGQLQLRLQRNMNQQLKEKQQQISWTRSRLPHPGRRVEAWLQRLDEIELRRNQAIKYKMQHMQSQLIRQEARLQHHSPGQTLARLNIILNNDKARLHSSYLKFLSNKKQKLNFLAHNLDTVSPLSTLTRGYAIATDKNQNVIRDSQQLKKGDTLTTRVASGKIISTVDYTEK